MNEVARVERRVVKVGGSLFDWPEFPVRLWRWLHEQPPAETYLLAGGGRLADAIRHYDVVLGLGEAASHQLCLELLGTTTTLLRVVISHAGAQLGPWPPQTSVVDVRDFVLKPTCTFPECWDVTTDSLAAFVARELGANELVLLKSASPAQPLTIAHAVESGYVDAYFGKASAGIGTIHAVNLRQHATCLLLW